MGTSVFAVKILKSLYQNGYPIATVYTQAPKKSNRGMRVTKSPVHSISETLSLEVRTPVTLKNNQEEYEYLKDIDADMCLVIAYGQIIPESFLNLTKKGFINIHASILPSWRGAAPIQRAIINLDKKTGISVMKINNKLDSGPVCNKYEIEIKKQDNSETISEKLSLIASEKILDEKIKLNDDMKVRVDVTKQKFGALYDVFLPGDVYTTSSAGELEFRHLTKSQDLTKILSSPGTLRIGEYISSEVYFALLF